MFYKTCLRLALALPTLPCPPAADSMMEVLPTPGTGPCPQLLGWTDKGHIELHFGQGPRVPAWAKGQLSPDRAEPGPPALAGPKERCIQGGSSEQNVKRCETKILALNHHVPWDSSLSRLTFMNPSADGGHHLHSPSPGLVGELKVMSAKRAEIRGRTNTLQRSRRKATTAYSLYYRI